MDCVDADVIIYAAEPAHPIGERIRALFESSADGELVGSVLLLPETLVKPVRTDATEAAAVRELLGRIVLHPVDRILADLATHLGAKYRLRAADAIHLATAVMLGADRFITNNRRDFDRDIAEVEVVFPEALPEPD